MFVFVVEFSQIHLKEKFQFDWLPVLNEPRRCAGENKRLRNSCFQNASAEKREKPELSAAMLFFITVVPVFDVEPFILFSNYN